MKEIEEFVGSLVKVVFWVIILLVLLAGGLKVSRWLFWPAKPHPQTVEEYTKPDVSREVKKKLSGASGVDIAPPEFPDVAAIQKSARHLKDLVAAKNGYNQIWVGRSQWPEGRLVSVKSPIIGYVNDLATTATGRFQCLLTTGQWQDIATHNPRSGQSFQYWRLDKPLYVDYASAIQTEGFSGTLIPAAQRSDDGLQYLQYWVYLADLAPEGPLPLAEWSEAKPMAMSDDKGQPAIIAAYTAYLKRGQTTKPLEFNRLLYPVQSWEVNRFCRKYQISCSDGTLICEINKKRFVISNQQTIDTSSADLPSGRIDINFITLAADSSAAEVPVTVVYSRFPINDRLDKERSPK